MQIYRIPGYDWYSTGYQGTTDIIFFASVTIIINDHVSLNKVIIEYNNIFFLIVYFSMLVPNLGLDTQILRTKKHLGQLIKSNLDKFSVILK